MGKRSRCDVCQAIVLLNCTCLVHEWVWPYIELATDRLAFVKNHGCATFSDECRSCRSHVG
jgi:hypothetical protein